MSKITTDALLFTLPGVLAEDFSDLARTVAERLAVLPESLQGLYLYRLIDSMPEGLLDILAYDYKVDWWDYDYSVEEKRAVLKNSWYVHRNMGTKSAVETTVDALFPGSTVEEWFEYGGEAYHFRLNINQTEGYDSEKHKRLLERVGYYKNLRSHMDATLYAAENQLEGSSLIYWGGTLSGYHITPMGVCMDEPSKNALDEFVLDEGALE